MRLSRKRLNNPGLAGGGGSRLIPGSLQSPSASPSPTPAAAGGALTSSQAGEGSEPVQVLGHLLPQVLESAGKAEDRAGAVDVPARAPEHARGLLPASPDQRAGHRPVQPCWRLAGWRWWR